MDGWMDEVNKEIEKERRKPRFAYALVFLYYLKDWAPTEPAFQLMAVDREGSAAFVPSLGDNSTHKCSIESCLGRGLPR